MMLRTKKRNFNGSFRLTALLLIMVMMTGAMFALVSCDEAGEDVYEETPPPEFGTALTGGMQRVAGNDYFELSVDTQTGEFEVLNKRTGEKVSSNPVDRDEDRIARDIWKTNMSSQLIIDYSNTGGTIFSQTNTFVGVVRKEGLKIYPSENGYIAVYHFPDAKIAVPLKVTLTDDGFEASVLADQITGDGNPNYLTGITLFPFLGAANTKQEGYMLVPDGSGALIRLNNGKTASGSYSGQIYGTDASYKPVQTFSLQKNSYLPVYGIKSGESALFAIITKGESLGTVNANVSGGRTSYNFIYPAFQLRARDTFFILDRSLKNRENYILDKKALQTKEISVRFFVLDKEKADYLGMAEKYKEYLSDFASFQGEVNKTGALYLDLYGGVVKTEPKLGIPVESTKVLTSYDDAGEIVAHLKTLGVDEFVLRLRNSQKADIEREPAKSFRLNGDMGTKEQFADLTAEVGEGRVYIAVDPINVRRDGSIFRTLRNTAQTVMGLPAFQLDYDMATGYKVTDDRWYFLSPGIAAEYFKRYIGGAVKSSSTSYVAVEELGNKLYSDYGRNWSNTEKTKETWIQALKQAKDAGAVMMMEGANSYVLPFAERLSGIPSSSSGFGVIDEEIPFLQLALNGLIEYSTEHINISSNPTRAFLKAIESDSCLSYSFIASDTVVLRNTELSYLYGASYKDWSEEVAENYKRYKGFKQTTGYTSIREHEIISEGIVRVTYENDAVVVINYTKDDVTVDGRKILALDFVTYERKG